jgi:Peptidase inhibitor family I36
MERFVKGGALGAGLVASLLLALGTGCGGGASSAPAPAAASAPTVCATFYADGQLKGATLVAKGPVDDSPTVPADFNDVMSSVAVTAGCTVQAYADGNYGGQEVTFTQTTETVPASINDQMSSYKCSCGSAGK